MCSILQQCFHIHQWITGDFLLVATRHLLGSPAPGWPSWGFQIVSGMMGKKQKKKRTENGTHKHTVYKSILYSVKISKLIETHLNNYTSPSPNCRTVSIGLTKNTAIYEARTATPAAASPAAHHLWPCGDHGQDFHFMDYDHPQCIVA